MRQGIAIAAAVLAAAIAVFAFIRLASKDGAPADLRLAKGDAVTLPDMCREILFERARVIACDVDPAADEIRIVHSGSDGAPYGSVPAFAAAVQGAAAPLKLAMNAGMYHADMRPVGLLVEDGLQMSPLETVDGAGNFYLKPNGVFFVGEDGGAGVMETAAFAAAKLTVRYATQSGPMLVIGGQIHPRFLPDGTSRYTRNGVGVTPDGTVVFAISRDPLSLGSFARFFRDAVDCPDALFFDGAVSSLWAGGETIIDSGHPAGPVVAVFGREALTQ